MSKEPVLGLDFLGTISDHPEFFSLLSNLWRGKVVIISHADNIEILQIHLNRFNIRYDKVICIPANMTKAQVVIEEGVDFYFDDGERNHCNIPASVSTFLVRGDGNFDFEKNRWKMDQKWHEMQKDAD